MTVRRETTTPEPLVRVTGMRLVDAMPRSDGSRVVASFEAVFPTFKLAGCMVVLDATGEPRAFAPEARSRTRDLPPITITDHTLLSAMQVKARKLYDRMVDYA